jgi:hypothetical protein
VHRNTRDIYPPPIRCSLKGNSSCERGHLPWLNCVVRCYPFISFCSSRSHALRGVGHQSSPDLALESVLPPFRNFHGFTPGFKRRIGFGIYLLLLLSLALLLHHPLHISNCVHATFLTKSSNRSLRHPSHLPRQTCRPPRHPDQRLRMRAVQ